MTKAEDWELIDADQYGLARLASDTLGIDHPLYRSYEKIAAEPAFDTAFHFDDEIIKEFGQPCNSSSSHGGSSSSVGGVMVHMPSDKVLSQLPGQRIHKKSTVVGS